VFDVCPLFIQETPTNQEGLISMPVKML